MSRSERRPRASVVIPTRARAGYLEIALVSIAPQATTCDAEIVVVSDGADDATAAVAARYDARVVVLTRAHGANAARNEGVAHSSGELVVFCDDDVIAGDGWLAALLAAAGDLPDTDVFGGPITARLEGGGPRACGREPAPITTLDLGPEDHDAPLVWSANMAVRRSALARIGPFDETIRGRGEEEDWQRRLRNAGGCVRYVADARVEHWRTARDSRLRALARAQYALGRTARRYDARKSTAPPAWREWRVLAGCLWHTARRRCAIGVVLAAHAAGRLRELAAGPAPVAEATPPLRPVVMAAPHARGPRDFLSGTSGQVWGIRATTRAVVLDGLADLVAVATARGPRLARAAAAAPVRRVLVVAVEREDAPNLLGDAVAELRRSHHMVEIAATSVGGRGKFENLNRLLAEHSVEGFDWLLVLDDDVALPPGFLDALLFLAERFGLRLAQPAHRQRSHAAWSVTRRRALSVVRETAFVEIGPVVAIHRDAFPLLLPFPPLRFGWGLDAHWSALARDCGWPIGVLDAVAVRHGLRRIAAAYDRGDAVAEGGRFLAGRPYTPAAEAARTLAVHRSWR